MTNQRQVAALVESAMVEFGKIDILINEDKPMGKHTLQWTAEDKHDGQVAESGLYLIRMIVQNNRGISSQTKP